MADLIQTRLDADGVLLATIDMPGRTMNVFSTELIAALDALIDRVEGDSAVHSCVITSGKPSFLAGADLAMVSNYCESALRLDHAQMFALCGHLGRQFLRIETSAKPWVAAINGLAMGGGLELALACRVRLVGDDARIQLAVPEVKLGLLPGAGGTQRLPRMIGLHKALDLLLSGRSLSPAQALQWGLVSRAVPAAELVYVAHASARALHGQPYVASQKFACLAQDEVPAHSPAQSRDLARQLGVDDESFVRYPAYSAIMDSVLLGARLPMAEANTVEMNQFLRLMFEPTAARMVTTLFLQRQRAERELAPLRAAKLASLRHGPLSAARRVWIEALGKLKLPREEDTALGPDQLQLICADGQIQTYAMRTLDDVPDAFIAPALAAPACLVLSPAGAYGRVLEMVGADADAAAAAAALAQSLWALPWRSAAPYSLLHRLRGASLVQQADIARAYLALPASGDAAFVDVAACLAGVAPAWSGGPLSWAARAGAEAVGGQTDTRPLA